MPPQLPGLCPICGEPATLFSELCWFCEEARHRGELHRRIIDSDEKYLGDSVRARLAQDEPPVAADDTRPARLAPPRREPAWLHGKITTVECHPSDTRLEEMLAGLGYTQTAEIKDPHTGLVTSHVWAKVTDEGC